MILIEQPLTLSRVARWIPTGMENPGAISYALLVCGPSEPEAPLGELVADGYDATTGLLLTARLNGCSPRCHNLFPDTDRMDEARRLLGIPETVIPFSVALISRPMRCPPDVVSELAHVHRETWR